MLMRQVLITGGAGFLGSHLCLHHLNLGDKVHVIDDLSTGSLQNLANFQDHPQLTFDHQSIVSHPNLENILKSMDIIYHFAAVVGVFRVLEQPEQVLSVNIGGTQVLLNAMRAIDSKARLIIASSSEVYGNCGEALLSEDRDLLISTQQPHRMNYPISKLVDEAYARTYSDVYGLNITVLRIFNIIGPSQTGFYGMVVPRFIRAAMQNKPIEIYGTGLQRRSFCDVRDFLNLLLKLVESELAIGQIVNIGHDEEISILDLAQLIVLETKSESKLVYYPYETVYHESFQDFMFRRPDLSKLKSMVEVSYKWDLRSSILDLIQDMRCQ
jgi:UDP-glucose 4-epimerase